MSGLSVVQRPESVNGKAHRPARKPQANRQRGSRKAMKHAKRLEQAVQANLIRCIAGNPLCPVPLDPAWLTWHDATIPKLAQAIYDDRDLPGGKLDNHRLAVLADAWEDAGCSD